MGDRPETSGSLKRPDSSPESLGVGTVAPSEANFDPLAVAGEVAEDITFSMFDLVLSGDVDAATADVIRGLTVKNEQLQAELDSTRTQKEELETRANQGAAEATSRELDDLKAKLAESEELRRRLEAAQSAGNGEQQQKELALHNEMLQLKSQLREARDQLASEKSKLVDSENQCQDLNKRLAEMAAAQPEGISPQEAALANEVTQLKVRLAEAEAIIAEQSEEAMRKDASFTQHTVELNGDSNSEEKPLLAAAYQQISVLNTQLAHLYTELTMARTEVQRLRSEQSSQGPLRSTQSGDSEAEVMKQSQQIADLVSDIRHLQLDLEYHQQKLDQMIEEKQQMMRDMKKCQGELEEAKRQIEERDQMKKHLEVDLQHLRDEMKGSPRAGQGSEFEGQGDGTLAALRSEAAAKDSALIVSHYELHKEKLLRDRLEQKNLKLMERMQKLMMVVETMRKENVTLERNLVAREQSCDSKEQQLRQVTQKAKQLQKVVKASKSGQKGGGKSYEMEKALPPLELNQSSRSMDSVGRRSGASTPRSGRHTPRAPASPYH